MDQTEFFKQRVKLFVREALMLVILLGILAKAGKGAVLASSQTWKGGLLLQNRIFSITRLINDSESLNKPSVEH